jgi:hypothetical protein
MWGAVSDVRTGMSFTIATGSQQRSNSRVRVPWDSRPYFTVSDSTLLFLLLPTTRRAIVEVLDPTSTRVTSLSGRLFVFYYLRPTTYRTPNSGVPFLVSV